MKKTWLVFGAGKGIGAQLVERAYLSHQPIVAFVRNVEQAEQLKAQGINVIIGDACHQQDVEKALQLAGEHCVVISTMGGEGVNYQGHRIVIDCAQVHGVKQMVLVTSIGCGDSWSTLSERAKSAFGQHVREKSLAEVWLQTSALDYCILRPGGLLNGDATGKAVSTASSQETHGFVRRADVALEIERRLSQPLLGCCTFSLVEPLLKPESLNTQKKNE